MDRPDRLALHSPRGLPIGNLSRAAERLQEPPSSSRADRSAHRLYVHLVWPTLARLPLIASEVAAVVEGHLIALCRRLDVEPVCVRARTDRVHVLVRLKPVHSVGTLVHRLKAGSEELLAAAGRGIRWGRGYAVTSVGSAEVRRTMRRIVHSAERPRSPEPLTRQTRSQ